MKKKPIKLQTTIILLVCGVVFASLLVSYLLIGTYISNEAQANLEEKAMVIARVVAKSPIVVDAMSGMTSTAEIQPFTDEIIESTNVRFVVVLDMNGIRLSHPDSEKIGQSFVGGDEDIVLKGNEHISIAQGTLGLSLRAFTPIYATSGEQIGAVSVGIPFESVQEAVSQNRKILYISLVFGICIGVVGAVLLARRIKDILFGLEPVTIATVFEERNVMLYSMFEGVFAVDINGRITLANDKARELLRKSGIEENPLNQTIDQYLSDIHIIEVIKTGETKFNREMEINGTAFLVNIAPLIVEKVVTGAILTFRDKSELKMLGQQLTGVRLYADALRAQAHEFMNKLHVILGMISMKSFDELPNYIKHISNQYQVEIGFISERIKDPVIAGFILGKLSNARERGVELTIARDSYLPEPNDHEVTHEIVTIVGNLIENAIEAVEESPEKSIDLLLSYSDKVLTILVWDTGSGISIEQQQKILAKGVSTKKKDRGYGLFLVQQSLEKLTGQLKISSEEGVGTSFTITLPYQVKGDNN